MPGFPYESVGLRPVGNIAGIARCAQLIHNFGQPQPVPVQQRERRALLHEQCGDFLPHTAGSPGD